MPKRVLPPIVLPAHPRAAARAGDDYGVSDTPDWRAVDWPAHLHRIEVAGASVNYVDIGEQGDHRPLVFVHGLSGQWQNWLENIAVFAAERRVVALDLPGFGGSPMPPEPISITFYGRVLAELCHRLDLSPAVLIGNSMGGYIAAEVAIQAPEIAERMMLLAAAGMSQMDIARGPMVGVGRIAGTLATAPLGQQKRIASRPRARHAVLSIVARHPTRLKADICFEGLMKGAGKPGFVPALAACLDYDFRHRVPEIGCPTWVVWGERDAIIPVADADAYTSLIHGARRVVLADTGHVPMIERPRTFNALVSDFLAHEVEEGEIERRPASPQETV